MPTNRKSVTVQVKLKEQGIASLLKSTSNMTTAAITKGSNKIRTPKEDEDDYDGKGKHNGVDSSSSYSAPSSEEERDDIHYLPTDLLIEHVVPYLDRQSLSRLSRTNHELKSEITTKVHNLPWPTRLQLTSSEKSSITSPTLKCIAFSPNSEDLVAGCTDGSIVRWNIISGQSASLEGGHHHCRPRPGGDENSVIAIAYSKDGKWLASASRDNIIVIWRCDGNEDCDDKDCKKTTSNSSNTTTLKFWKKIQTDGGHITCLSFSPNDDFLASGHANNERIKLWNVSHGVCITEFFSNFGNQILSMDVSNDGQHILATADDGSIKLLDIRTSVYELWVGGHTNAVGQLPSGGLVVASSSSAVDDESSHIVMLWNRESKEHFQLLLDIEHPAINFCFSPNAEKLASIDNWNAMKVWDVASGNVEMTLKNDKEEQFSSDSLVFSSDSKLIAAISKQQSQIQIVQL